MKDPDILVIGQSGQLAQALKTRLPSLVMLGRHDFDLSQDDLEPILDKYQPSTVINAAAYTDVNRAEDDEAAAMALNADGPARLAKACHTHNIGCLHISSDYVFNGRSAVPYDEADQTHPINIYGQTKRIGELSCLDANPDMIIVRASWVFGDKGGSFLKAILNRADQGLNLNLVNDQISAPTYADDLAQALIQIANAEHQSGGIFHYQGGEYASWYDFGVAAIKLAQPYLDSMPQLKAVDSSAFPQTAQRPLDTRLKADKIAAIYQIGPGNWVKGLQGVISKRYST